MDVMTTVETLRFHRFLLGQTKARLRSYRRAIAATIKPGDTVLDLGSGSGVLAFFACQAGARRVYALEHGPSIELARLLARKNGFQDRILFIGGSSRELDLPEQVDAIVTDTVSFWQAGALSAIIDVRERWLEPGGQIIPRSIEIVVALAEVPEIYKSHIDFWARRTGGVDLSPVRDVAVHLPYPVRIQERSLVSEPASLTRLALADLEAGTVDGKVRLRAHRACTVHGVCAWMVSELADQVVVGNGPGHSSTNYLQAFFPFSRPLAVAAGAIVDVDLQSDDNVQWRWAVEAEDRLSASQSRERISQSSFEGMLLSPDALRKLAIDRTPTLSARGEAERFILDRADGKTSIAELHSALLKQYPVLFRSEEDAMSFVAEVIGRCA